LEFGACNLVLPVRASLVALALSCVGNPLFAAAEMGPGTPPYVQRGDAVEARYRAYKERLERVYETLRARVRADAPDLSPQLEKAAPKPLAHGYQILPKLIPDVPPPAAPLRATSAHYSWPWTETMIEREMKRLDALAATLDDTASLDRARRRSADEKMLADYRELPAAQRNIDAHIQYNRLWQPNIARDRRGYDRQTILHDAVVERQAIRDALGATDTATAAGDAAGEGAFRKALNGISGIDAGAPRNTVKAALRAREQTLAQEIRVATDDIAPPPFLHIAHPSAHLWIVNVPVFTDIADRAFVRAWKHAVETIWHLRDRDDEFRVRIAVTFVSPAQLSCPAAAGRQPAGCPRPHHGELIDLNAHAARFPAGGAVLTTGALTTHVTAGRCLALGPHDVTPHTLAHEFGHILGFKDVYFRGYRDLGADGFEVMEVIADPEDIMGAPGIGPVRRHHFERLIAVK
jgi:hypothetical protein